VAEPSLIAYFFLAALTFAHRALAAAEILARAAALIRRFFFRGGRGLSVFEGAPRICWSSFSSDSICSLIAAARLSCSADRLASDVFIADS